MANELFECQHCHRLFTLRPNYSAIVEDYETGIVIYVYTCEYCDGITEYKKTVPTVVNKTGVN